MIGYCTNVHAGANLAQVQGNLQTHAIRVQQLLGHDEPLGLGLWLSSDSARALAASPTRCGEFAAWLSEHMLVPYTMNAFPYGNFHGAVVKHDVYQPPWWDARRTRFTIDVARVFDKLMPVGRPGTISTLPVGWPTEQKNAHRDRDVPGELWRRAAEQLGVVARALAELERTAGRHLRLCLEPEPGCLLESAEDVARFFNDHLRQQLPRELVARYLGVCHDICHAAVMYEPQAAALATYAAADVVIGKVQVSSAVVVRWSGGDPDQHVELVSDLVRYAENRYLHQTVVRVGWQLRFYDDLPRALEAETDRDPAAEWRIHFHVPVFARQLGQLDTSQAEIGECLEWLARHTTPSSRPALEIETYAWEVMPNNQDRNLAGDIASEITWLRNRLERLAWC